MERFKNENAVLAEEFARHMDAKRYDAAAHLVLNSEVRMTQAPDGLPLITRTQYVLWARAALIRHVLEEAVAHDLQQASAIYTALSVYEHDHDVRLVPQHFLKETVRRLNNR